MHTSIAFHGCPENVATDVKEYWTSTQSQLETLLAASEPREPQLDLWVHYEAQMRQFAVRAVLPLSFSTLTAEARDENVRAALDEVKHLLMQGIQRPVAEESLLATDAENNVDTASADSFPASDAPSWTPVTAAGPPAIARK